MKLSQNILDRIIEICKDRKQLQRNDKNIKIYHDVAVTIENEFDIHLDNEQIRRISRNYRENNKLDENFESIIIENIKENVDEIKNIHKELNDNDLIKGYKETIEIHSDGKQSSDKLIKMSNEESKDVNFLLESHGYDRNSWSLISARNNIWNVYSKQDGIQTLYSSKIVVRPIEEFIWTEENANKVFENLKTNYKNKIDIKPQTFGKNGNILIIPIADFHYGLLSDKYSTGNDYNLEIAERIYYYTLNDIINRVCNNKFEKVLFVVGNDFINADNLNGTTTKNTPQDNAALWFSIVCKATQLIIDGIDMLSNIAPVDVVYVTSNHDLHTMFGIMQTIKAWYRNDNNVNIDDSPMPRKYYKFKKTILGLSHDIKVKDALQLFTSEAKDMWSECNHMIWLLAHLHQSMVYDKQGYLEILRLPTVSGWSRWSNSMGYIQSEKKNKSFIINGDLGITDELNTIIL